jgi:hypothetical protein
VGKLEYSGILKGISILFALDFVWESLIDNLDAFSDKKGKN